MTNKINMAIGYILLAPPILSVFLFMVNIFSVDVTPVFMKLALEWTGALNTGPGGGGYTSALPFYFGLMAIAGVYLIKESKK